MTTLSYVSYGVGLLGLLFGLRCYVELWRWAKQCQRARIIVGYKRRTTLQAPLVEWLVWCNQLQQDKLSSGRVIYHRDNTTIMIGRALKPPGRIRQVIKRGVTRQKGVTSKTGKWTAKDQTREERIGATPRREVSK